MQLQYSTDNNLGGGGGGGGSRRNELRPPQYSFNFEATILIIIC
jgi:hypothetical protein